MSMYSPCLRLEYSVSSHHRKSLRRQRSLSLFSDEISEDPRGQVTELKKGRVERRVPAMGLLHGPPCSPAAPASGKDWGELSVPGPGRWGIAVAES